jgi:hypothetical protein
MAVPALRLFAPRREITAADAMRLVSFPVVRREISDALVQRPIQADITPNYVRYRLKNPRAFHPALFAVIRVGSKGTMLVIGTPRNKIKKPAAFSSFIRRMGWTGSAWSRKLSTMERRSMIYQLRKANVIGGSETQSVLVPRRRVEAAAAKFQGSIRRTGTNPLSEVESRDVISDAYKHVGMASSMERDRRIRQAAYFSGRADGMVDVVMDHGPRRLRGVASDAYKASTRAIAPFAWNLRTNPDTLEKLKRDRDNILRVLNRPMATRVFQQLLREVDRINKNIRRLEGRPVGVATNSLIRRVNPLVHKTTPQGSFWKEIDYRDMADALGLDLWGNTPQGDLRVAPKGSPQPTGAISYAALKKMFDKQFRLIRDPRKMSVGYLMIVPRARKNPLLRAEGITLAGGRVRSPSFRYAKRTYLKAHSRAMRWIGKQGGGSFEIKASRVKRATKRKTMRQWGMRSRPRRNASGRNPILATLGIAANPNPQGINIPFRAGQKVKVEAVRRWLASIPDAATRQALTGRFEANIKQYKRFHLGSTPKDFTFQQIPLGTSRKITDIDFVTSEGKEWAAPYQVPRHSAKYTKDTQGRYLHAHGDSDIDIKEIKKPANPKILPERFHTADGKFVGVIPKRQRITDWYRH